METTQKKAVAYIQGFNKWLTAVETKVCEAKMGLSVAEKMVILRTACEQVSNQLVVSGLLEAANEDALEPDGLVNAFRVGKKARGGRQQLRQGATTTRSLIVTLKNGDS